MDFQFDVDEWRALSNIEKARRCQSMADEALKLAKVASPDSAERYIGLSEEWLKLAQELVTGETAIGSRLSPHP